jgi:integrase
MLNHDVIRYLQLRRATGFKYRVQGILLRNFACFAAGRGDEFVRTQTVLEWAAMAPSPAQRRNRLLTVRRFAETMGAEDPRHQVPPADALGREQFRRRTPYIFTPEEIRRLLRAASGLTPKGSIRPATYTTLFALLAATGMRISEALALKITDVSDDGLIVRETKFNKSRLVPLHDTARRGLEHYLGIRAPLRSSDLAVFLSLQGRALSYSTVIQVFLRLVRAIGLHHGPGTRGPRLHDFRHTFAVRCLEQAVGDGKALASHIVALSTYLGHAHVTDTYWYLEATPALMEGIAATCETYLTGGQP